MLCLVRLSIVVESIVFFLGVLILFRFVKLGALSTSQFRQMPKSILFLLFKDFKRNHFLNILLELTVIKYWLKSFSEMSKTFNFFNDDFSTFYGEIIMEINIYGFYK